MGIRVVPRAFSSSLVDEFFISSGVALRDISVGIYKES